VKEKARFFQLQRHQQPELVSVNTSELDERVCNRVPLGTPCAQVVDAGISVPRPKNTRFTTQCHSCSLACSPQTVTRSTAVSSRSASSSKIRQSQHCTGYCRNRVLRSGCFCDVPLSHAVDFHYTKLSYGAVKLRLAVRSIIPIKQPPTFVIIFLSADRAYHMRDGKDATMSKDKPR